jgi:hypothetical protein
MNRKVKPRTLKVISMCPVCEEPVNANSDDIAPRHGFKRYVRSMSINGNTRSQEDDKPCAGSGKEVIYKRVK